MSRAQKLAAKILSGKSDTNFAFAELCYVLERVGFQSRPGKEVIAFTGKKESSKSSIFSRGVAEKRSRIR
jgi:hypothetical protein